VTGASPAREISFRILQQVEKGGYASDLLRRDTAGLEPRDAALAESIVFGCLRRRSQLDFLILHYSGKSARKLDDAVRLALHMGVFQLRYLDRIPPHAAVTESVELVKLARKRSAAGFVNAVLRKVNRNPVEWPDRATELSLPGWLLERWEQHYGAPLAAGIAAAALEEPEKWMNPVTGLQQDIGAQFIVPLLEIKPGMTVLDLCAAPGNKTAQVIAAGGRVVACDRYYRRLENVPAQAARIVLDATDPLPLRGGFDRILVDAPCSGTGTLAHNPEIKWRLQPADIEVFADRQRKILANALASLKPGGRVVYSTCSLETEENETVIRDFGAREIHTRLPGREPGDGFFAAVIAT
jgi:16S rRNA (cytosine967-C5)-methyltransferase